MGVCAMIMAYVMMVSTVLGPASVSGDTPALHVQMHALAGCSIPAVIMAPAAPMGHVCAIRMTPWAAGHPMTAPCVTQDTTAKSVMARVCRLAESCVRAMESAAWSLSAFAKPALLMASGPSLIVNTVRRDTSAPDVKRNAQEVPATPALNEAHAPMVSMVLGSVPATTTLRPGIS
jgi:hypothetical protein